jgi:hypothetical protein
MPCQGICLAGDAAAMAEATADVSPEDLKAIIDYLVAEANPWPTIDTDSKGHRLPLAQSSPLSLAVSRKEVGYVYFALRMAPSVGGRHPSFPVPILATKQLKIKLIRAALTLLIAHLCRKLCCNNRSMLRVCT